ncbi:hypothetical protein [Terriglobus aquaticus]|uniref:Uncharacterized protein n=1 Tax=Terriglobus aquaticus TaxID=940139 RepID=A0ABW9KKE8_9BACT|nr:hypothetical protein [Terriglobus aquaticus]
MLEEKGATATQEAISEEEVAEFLRKPCSLPNNLVITLCYFADKDDAERCGQAVRFHLEIFGRVMDLSQLEQVFISFNYPETLASIDRGVGATQVIIPTADDVATGIAMAPTVKRGDVWKSVIALNASYARSLSYEPEDPSVETQQQLQALRALTIHTIAHECGHVHDHAMQMKHMGADTFLQKWAPVERYLKEPAMACWSEFMAEYLSAQYGNAETLKGYEDGFCDRLKNAWPAITESIRHYRMHGNVERVLSEVSIQIRHVIVYAGYLFGYLAKTDVSLADAAPKAATEINAHSEFASLIMELREGLMKLLDVYPKFADLNVFNPLSDVVRELYNRAGFTFRENPDGSLHLDIPHRPDTMPTLAEQLAFRTGNL